METVIIIVVILAVLLALALIAIAMKRKKEKVGRQRASELRSDAALTAAEKTEQEARAREAEAEAARARAQADKLDARADKERTSYDMTRAKQEDAVREADRLDPDVDHRSKDYQPDLNGGPAHQEGTHDSRTWNQQQGSSGSSAVSPDTHRDDQHGSDGIGPDGTRSDHHDSQGAESDGIGSGASRSDQDPYEQGRSDQAQIDHVEDQPRPDGARRDQT